MSLGMDRAALLALDGASIAGSNANACQSFSVLIDGREVTGGVEPSLGVTQVNLPDGATTPEGIGSGSQQDELLAAYPESTGDDQLFTTPVPGYGDRSYRVELDPDGNVGGIMLLHKQQSCGG